MLTHISACGIMELGGDTLPISESGRRATRKYKQAHIRRIALDVQKEEYDRIASHARANGSTINGYIKQAVRKRMEVEKDV